MALPESLHPAIATRLKIDHVMSLSAAPLFGRRSLFASRLLKNPFWRVCFSRKSTSEPLGVVFDRAEGRTVAQAAIDHCVNGQEVRHSAGKETSILKRMGKRVEEEMGEMWQMEEEIPQGQED